MAQNDQLRGRQAAFVAALLLSSTIEEAAEVAHISRRTATRYLKKPTVKAALSAALDAEMGQAARRAVAAMSEAVDTLSTIHKDSAAGLGARVSAARTLLENGPKLREALDLAERVAELEQRIAGREEG